jgi:hypothetical protein
MLPPGVGDATQNLPTQVVWVRSPPWAPVLEKKGEWTAWSHTHELRWGTDRVWHKGPWLTNGDIRSNTCGQITAQPPLAEGSLAVH